MRGFVVVCVDVYLLDHLVVSVVMFDGDGCRREFGWWWKGSLFLN